MTGLCAQFLSRKCGVIIIELLDEILTQIVERIPGHAGNPLRAAPQRKINRREHKNETVVLRTEPAPINPEIDRANGVDHELRVFHSDLGDRRGRRSGYYHGDAWTLADILQRTVADVRRNENDLRSAGGHR